MSEVMAQMQTIGTLPDGRTLYYADEKFTDPGFYVNTPGEPGQHQRVELIFARGTEAGRAQVTPKPTIGRIVHYFSPANGEPGEVAQPKAAIVVGVFGNEGDCQIDDDWTAHLLVFDSVVDTGQLRLAVRFNPAGPATLDEACWRWPERV